ncbi:4-alpha-glucanotransferase [Schaalia sp. 19OD2882]|uniref:4-alpha-glucanotransferase n=1 Tax=Schaalia sp. 19OD2882 TaxID=2794089 RepID=UPI001C1EC3E7|nr:4-alpha-glucanotransferase [Schaalia sp. 19OD2882]QWW20643.1 4-alpha-glucanotransferase [Schaalia sp. 19OD2882]
MPTAEADIDLLRHLADVNGVATGFWDWYGNWKAVSADSLLRVLASLGVDVTPQSTVADVRAALEETEDAHWRRTLPPTIVVRQGSGAEFPVHVPDGHWVSVTWVLEDGGSGMCEQVDRWVPPRRVDDAMVGRATFRVPSHLPIGWHRLVATVEGGHVHSATLIVTPNSLHVPAQDGKRRWGVSAQLYSTRSARSWGMGDAEDLADLLAVCGDRGADFLLINPVHASAPVAPIENSPYLPVTRRWVNPLYVRPEAVEEFAQASPHVRAAVEELRLATAPVEEKDTLVDRDRSWEAKRKALELVFALPRSIHRDSQFRRFVARGGTDLANFALWCALVERAEGTHLPEEVSWSGAPGTDRARLELADRIEFWQWCQWIASEQLAHAQAVAVEIGMDLGVMADLAVGVHPRGSEIWSDPHMFARGISVGAPPDMYSQQGQDWSQPPWSPRALAEAGYAPLRDMARAAVASAGAVRIDHILGLFRLWWIPEGQGASAGTYVYYDHEAMVGVVLLEAQKAGALVIGEDLGTVEPWVRDYLRDRGILGTSVLWFEKEDSGWPMHADWYRRECLAAVTTHDLPPTAGYVEGIQTTLRDRLGLLVEDVEAVRAADLVEREQMAVRLREYGLTTSADPSVQERVEAMHGYMARTPALLVVAGLVDAVGDKRPQNLPGTDKEYPNWCIPLCDAEGVEVLIDDLPTNDRLGSLFSKLDHTVHS